MNTRLDLAKDLTLIFNNTNIFLLLNIFGVCKKR